MLQAWRGGDLDEGTGKVKRDRRAGFDPRQRLRLRGQKKAAHALVFMLDTVHSHVTASGGWAVSAGAHRHRESSRRLGGIPRVAGEGWVVTIPKPVHKTMRERGLEPLSLAAPDPKSGASASFATLAFHLSQPSKLNLRRPRIER